MSRSLLQLEEAGRLLHAKFDTSAKGALYSDDTIDSQAVEVTFSCHARIFQEYINDWRVRAHISEIPGKIPLWDFIADDQFSQPGETIKITGRGGCAKYCGTAPSPGNISFSSFRQSFTSNVNYLKRRFSSGDLSSELDDEPNADPGLATVGRQDSSQPYQAVPERPLQSQPGPIPPPSQPPVPGAPPPQPIGGDLSLNLRPGSRTTSAPSSPAKTRESLLQRVQSLTGAARDQGASILGAAVSGATRGPSYSKDRCFTLLVIDDQNTDWSKYFRGRRLHSDYEIRVEQAEFRELSLTASETGTIVSMAVYRNGTKVIRSFKPDFVLIRQNLRDAGEDYKNLLLGLMYGGVPSVNNLTAIYNFQDKPWVFAHLLGLQRRLGKDNFPLIEQSYYPNHREMVSRESIGMTFI
ncbi:hypothetical protein HN011_007717 [Eciton burchellii]|nr:hypothetical protein HN011_007717 [Eciton burchellii]